MRCRVSSPLQLKQRNQQEKNAVTIAADDRDVSISFRIV